MYVTVTVTDAYVLGLHASAGNPRPGTLTASSDSHTYVPIVRGHQNIPISIHIHTVRTYGTYIHTYDICTFESPVDSGYSYVHWGWLRPTSLAIPTQTHTANTVSPYTGLAGTYTRTERDVVEIIFDWETALSLVLVLIRGDLSATPHNLHPAG